MISGDAAVILNLLIVAILALLFGIAIACSSSFVSVESWRKFSAEARRSLLWITVSLPWAFSAGTILLALVTSIFNVTPWLDRLYHWHHNTSFDVISWHSFLVIIFLALFSTLAIAACYQVVKLSQLQRLLRFMQGNENVLPMQRPIAFTAGILSPQIFLSSGLVSSLNADEKNIVFLHEQAHQRRRDPAKKWVFGFLTAFYPKLLRLELRREMSLCMEQCADEAVVATGKAGEYLAKVMVRVSKIMKNSLTTDISLSLHCRFNGAELTERVHYLVLPQTKKPLPLAWLWPTLISLFVLCLLQVDVVHHAVELIFQH